MCTVPEDIPVSKAFPIGCKRRTPSESKAIILNEDGSLSPDSDTSSNTLLRQLLVGTDPDRVRNYSELVNAKFALRRTSSMSLSSYNDAPRNLNPDDSNDVRPRRATMFSHLTLHKKSPYSSSSGITRSKRPRADYDSVLEVKVESVEPEDPPATSESDAVVVKPANKWRLLNHLSPTSTSSAPLVSSASTSHVDSITAGVQGMRPRAHTASELESALEVFERCMLDKNFPKGSLARASRSLDPISVQNLNDEANGEKSDIASPLSQLLESTPPYNTNASVTRTSAKAYPSLKRLPPSNRTQPMQRPRTATVSGVDSNSLRRLTHNSQAKPDLQVLNLSQGTSPTDALTFLASHLSESAKSLEIPNSVPTTEERVLNFSLKDNLTTATNLLPLVNDDLFHATVLQQLFCRVGLPLAEAPPTSTIGLTPSSNVPRLTLSNLPPAWPIRLAAKNSHMICRRVGEWMLTADAYTMRCCPTIAPNALLATAASYRYCRCLETDQATPAKIAVTHALPKISATLKSVLTRIWPQLLLTYMIRENFSFNITPVSLAEFEALTLERRGGEFTNGKSSVDARDLLIARLGTAHSLLNMIENGNQLLDSQVLECVRRCIFAQYAFPNYFPVSYRTAMEDLRRGCQQCSGDSSLFANVVLLMNEMHSISPDGLHCLFSIDKLSALFSNT